MLMWGRIFFPIYKRENIFEPHGNHYHHSKRIGILISINEVDKKERRMKFYKAIKRQPLPQQFYTTKNQHQQYLEQNNPFNGGDE